MFGVRAAGCAGPAGGWGEKAWTYLDELISCLLSAHWPAEAGRRALAEVPYHIRPPSPSSIHMSVWHFLYNVLFRLLSFLLFFTLCTFCSLYIFGDLTKLMARFWHDSAPRTRDMAKEPAKPYDEVGDKTEPQVDSSIQNSHRCSDL